MSQKAWGSPSLQDSMLPLLEPKPMSQKSRMAGPMTSPVVTVLHPLALYSVVELAARHTP